MSDFSHASECPVANFPLCPLLTHHRSLLLHVSTGQEAIITGLLPETTYSVILAAYTTKGDGARSKAKVVTTTGAGVFVFICYSTFKNFSCFMEHKAPEMLLLVHLLVYAGQLM